MEDGNGWRTSHFTAPCLFRFTRQCIFLGCATVAPSWNGLFPCLDELLRNGSRRSTFGGVGDEGGEGVGVGVVGGGGRGG